MMWPTPQDPPGDGHNRRFHPMDERDVEVAYLVIERLLADTRISSQPVRVEVQHGVVVLTGAVDSGRSRDLIGAAARDVEGVRDLCNALAVPDDGGTPAVDRDQPGTARHEPRDDEQFWQLVEPLAQSGRTTSAGRTAVPMIFKMLFLALWVALTVFIIRLGPAGAALICAAAATFMAEMRRRSRRPPSR